MSRREVIKVLVLGQEGQEPRPVDSFDVVEEALQQLHPRSRSYVTLEASDGSYVQVAGATLRLIIEHRQVGPGGFRHFVLGRPDSDERMISINYSGGPIQLQRGEVLTVADAREVFRGFFFKGEAPGGYARREVTDAFRQSGSGGAAQQ